MHLCLSDISHKEVMEFSNDHQSYFARGYHKTQGYFASKHRSNLGSIVCHNPWNHYITSINDTNRFPLKDVKFITGYMPNENIDSILFDTEGPYKKLYELSQDVKRVVLDDGTPCALLIPNEWFSSKDNHTLFYSFLIQSRDPYEFQREIKAIPEFKKLGFDKYESYILSRCFSDKLVKLGGWNGGHSIFNGGINYTKFKTGNVTLEFKGNQTSQLWRGSNTPHRIVTSTFYEQVGGFGKAPELVDKDGLIQAIRTHFDVSYKREEKANEKA